MNRLTPEQRLQIVEFYFENNGSVRKTYRALRPFYHRQNRPSEQLIRLTMERFRTTFTLMDNSHPQRRCTVRTEEGIAAVERSIEEDPNESIRHRAQELDLGPSTLWKILRKDLGLRAYENELEQEVNEEVAEAAEEAVTKPKGKGKKSETKIKKIKASKANVKIQNAEEVLEEVVAEAGISVVEIPGKKSKVIVSKHKKQDANEKEIENEEAKQEEIEEEPIEKGSKRTSRGSKKVNDTSIDAESPKNKKMKKVEKKLAVNNDSVVSISFEVKTETKKAKKPTKRSRKAVSNSSDPVEEATSNGDADATEEVLPKKRSRKAVSAEKEIVAEKPKKGRDRKATKAAL